MKLLVIAILTASAGIALWQSAPRMETFSPAEETDDVVIASYLQAGTRTFFSTEGDRSDVLEIGSATRWSDSDEVSLSEIRYRAKGDNDTAWDITASAGTFFEDINELVLQNGVTVIETERQATMTTEAMRLFMDQKRATGEQDVLLTGRGSRTSGSSFELDLQTNTATLKGDVVTQYE